MGQVGGTLVASFLLPLNKNMTFLEFPDSDNVPRCLLFVPTAYNKPHLIDHQFLEPERVKELSRSSPLLLSEVGWMPGTAGIMLIASPLSFMRMFLLHTANTCFKACFGYVINK